MKSFHLELDGIGYFHVHSNGVDVVQPHFGGFSFFFNGVGIFVGRGRIFVDKGRILQVELNSLGHLMGWFKNGNFRLGFDGLGYFWIYS